MSAFTGSRRRVIARHGRMMTLRRQTGVDPVAFIDVGLLGVFSSYRPEQITAGVKAGDASVAITNDEIAAIGWPGPPRSGDALVIDGRTWQVIGVMRVFDGAATIGAMLWVRGGG